MCSNLKRTTAGFTLAEVVLGVLLLGLTATLLGRAISDSLRTLSQTDQHESYGYPLYKVRNTVLRLPTRDQVEEGGELEVPTTRRSKENQGETEEQETVMLRVEWEAEVKPTRLLNVYQVELVVNVAGDDNDSEKIERKLLTYRTGWADAEEMETLLAAKEDEFKERRTARGENIEEPTP